MTSRWISVAFALMASVALAADDGYSVEWEHPLPSGGRIVAGVEHVTTAEGKRVRRKAYTYVPPAGAARVILRGDLNGEDYLGSWRLLAADYRDDTLVIVSYIGWVSASVFYLEPGTDHLRATAPRPAPGKIAMQDEPDLGYSARSAAITWEGRSPVVTLLGADGTQTSYRLVQRPDDAVVWVRSDPATQPAPR